LKDLSKAILLRKCEPQRRKERKDGAKKNLRNPIFHKSASQADLQKVLFYQTLVLRFLCVL